MRLDKYLFEHGYADSRNRASEMIKSGKVSLNGKLAGKTALEVTEADEIKISDDILKYVSRAALKLAAALERTGLVLDGATAADLGASTGGFTEVLLEHGVKWVHAIDIGHGQLHPKLAADTRVISLEGTNARTVTPELIGGKADIVCADLSFISQTLVHEAISAILKEGGIFIGLIKPQFEAGREHIGKGGIVKDRKVHIKVIENTVARAAAHGLSCFYLEVSPITGGDGNTEFLSGYVKHRDTYIPSRSEIESIVNGGVLLRKISH